MFSLLPGIRTARYQDSQVSLVVTLLLSRVLVNKTIILGGVDLRACL